MCVIMKSNVCNKIILYIGCYEDLSWYIFQATTDNKLGLS